MSEAEKQEQRRLLELADRLAQSRDAQQQDLLKKELARIIFTSMGGTEPGLKAPRPAALATRTAVMLAARFDLQTR